MTEGMSQGERMMARARAMTPEQRAEWHANRQREQAELQAQRDREQAEYLATNWATETLEARVAAAEADPSDRAAVVAARYAGYLLRLDTPERRRRAQSESYTLGNLRGGRPSDNLWDAVNDLLRMVAAGTEDQEMYGERVAREDRERQQADRAAQLSVAAAQVQQYRENR